MIRGVSWQNYLHRFKVQLKLDLQHHQLTDKVNIETENKKILNYIKDELPDVGVWLSSYGELDKDLNDAIETKYTGISIRDGAYITEEAVNTAHKNGIKLSVWTVNSAERIQELTDWNVDYIQTDRLF